MLIDEYKRRLLDEVKSGSKFNCVDYNSGKIIDSLNEIISIVEKIKSEPAEKWNQYDFSRIKKDVDMILVRISYIKKIYDFINLISSDRLLK